MFCKPLGVRLVKWYEKALSVVILSVATQRIARRSRSKKNPKKFKTRFKFNGYFANAQYDKDFVILSELCERKIHTLNLWILRCAQYDKMGCQYDKAKWILDTRLSVTSSRCDKVIRKVEMSLGVNVTRVAARKNL